MNSGLDSTEASETSSVIRMTDTHLSTPLST